MIILITEESINKKTGKKEIVISHGINMNTMKNVVLPEITLKEIGAEFIEEIGEWVIEDKTLNSDKDNKFSGLSKNNINPFYNLNKR